MIAVASAARSAGLGVQASSCLLSNGTDIARAAKDTDVLRNLFASAGNVGAGKLRKMEW